ncbi:MAG: VWA domain-containing protein [Acidobacteriota bacterium]|jgi:Ca-activated chloride channel family protein
MNSSTQRDSSFTVRNILLVGLGLLATAVSAVTVSPLSWSRTRQSQNPPNQQQQQQPPGQFKIGVEVNMVTVPVTVRKPNGGFIRELPKEAFLVKEDGVPQEVLTFSQEALPTHIAILLDISGSVNPEWGSIKYATKKFIENLKFDDQFALITFNTETRLRIDWCNKSDRLEDVLSSVYCKDNTNLWDAIYVVCNDLFKGIQEKKAVILMSDGLDNNSTVSYKDMLDDAIRSQAAVYVVSKTQAVRESYIHDMAQQGVYTGIPEKEFAAADDALKKLSYETGGRVLYPTNFGQLDNIYAQVDEELRNQYTLGYLSTNTAKDGTYRRIEVAVNARQALISARPGYYAPSQSPVRK